MYARQIACYDVDGNPVTVEFTLYMSKMQRVKFLNDNPGFMEKFKEACKNFDFSHFYPLIQTIPGRIKLSITRTESI